MKIERWLLLLVVAAVLGATQPKNPDAALGAAWHLEEAEGNYPAAIEAYKKFLSQYGKDRVLAAKALVRMGQCYEKLGDAEARKAYERVVREFGEQKDSATTARTRLAALGRASAPAGISVRRVFEDLPGEASAVSPDGRLVLHYEDRTTSNHAVRDWATGQSRRVTAYEKFSNYLSYDPMFSPDSRRIAYVSWPDRYELHIVGVNGSGDRVVWRSEDWFELKGWFPDGSRLVVFRWPDKGPPTLLAVSVADGAVKVLKERDATLTSGGWLSPDGKYFAFLRQKGSDRLQRDIWCLSLEDGSETPLAVYPANNKNPRWTPDGKGILFDSDRRGTVGLWYLPVSAGKPAGAPELIKGDVGETFWPIGLTRDGTLYYESKVAMTDSFMAEFDPATGKIVSGPSEIAPKSSGHTQNATFSTDGQWLAYCRSSAYVGKKPTLIVRSLTTGEEREMATRFTKVHAQRWFPDGRSLLVYATDSQNGRGYHRFDIAAGRSTLLATSRTTFHALSPDGKTLYLVRGQQGGGKGWGDVYAAELDPGTGKVLAPPARVASRFLGTNIGPSWSPDGQYLAYHSWRGPLKFDEPGALTIVIKSAKTGEERDLSVKLQQAGPARWFPDGKSFLVRSALEGQSGRPPGFYRINAESGEVSLIKRITPADSWGPELSPDGKAIFYWFRDAGKDQHLMVYQMETGEEKELFRIVSPQSMQGSWRLCPSPDGRQLAFVLGDPATNSAAIKILPARGGEVRELVGGLRYRDVAYGALGGWSPDGRYLFFAMGGQSAGLWRVSTEGGEPQKLDVNMKDLRYPAVHPDGRRISFNAGIPHHALCSRNLETGEEHELLQNDDVSIYPAVSPDGKQLAVARVQGDDSLIEILPLGDGNRREIFRARAGEALLGFPAWSPDGREIFFSRRAPKGERVELWRVSAQGGTPTRTDVWVPQVREQGQDWEAGRIVPAPADYSVQQLRGLAFHPDGRRFVFDAGFDRAEFWAMENFLPKKAK